MPAKGYRTAEVKAWREAGGRERNASTRSLAGAQPCDCLDEPGGIDGPEPAGHVVAFRGLEAGDDRGRLGRGSARPRAEEPERVRALLDIDDPAVAGVFGKPVQVGVEPADAAARRLVGDGDDAGELGRRLTGAGGEVPRRAADDLARGGIDVARAAE